MRGLLLNPAASYDFGVWSWGLGRDTSGWALPTDMAVDLETADFGFSRIDAQYAAECAAHAARAGEP